MDYLEDKYKELRNSKTAKRARRYINNFRNSKYLDKETYTLEEIEKDLFSNELIKYIKSKAIEV